MNTPHRCAHPSRYAAWPPRLRRRGDTARRVIARLQGVAQEPAAAASRWDRVHGFAAVPRILRRSAGASFHALHLLQFYLDARCRVAVTNASRSTLERFAPPARGATAQGATVERRVMLERVMHGRRLEHIEHRHERTIMQRTPAREVVRHRVYPPVAQTVMRAAGTAPVREAAMAGRSVQQSRDNLATAAEVARARASEPVALAPQELSRVTDHVIQQLDRRVLSFRERHGLL